MFCIFSLNGFLNLILCSLLIAFFTDMRIKYKGRVETFTEDKLVSKNPIIQFKDWFEIARSTPEINEPTAMILATATK